MEDNFEFDLENIKVEREKKEYKLTQLKLTHYYWNYDVYKENIPVTTSIELISKNIKEEGPYAYEWHKIIRHTHEDKRVDIKDEKLTNLDIVKELEKYDLRELKNNYFTEFEPECNTHWELEYNDHFKITGTYDQMIDEIRKISEILKLKENLINNGGNTWKQ